MGKDSQSKGRLAELRVIAELVRNGSTSIYTPVIDVEGIDLIIRRQDGSYAELQVKSRSRSDQSFQVGRLAPSDDRYIVLHVLDTDSFWVIPSKEFIRMARARGDVHTLTWSRQTDREARRYRNDWELINDRAQSPVGREHAAAQPQRVRLVGEHHTESYYYPFILKILGTVNRAMRRKEIVAAVYDQVKESLTELDRQNHKSTKRPRWEGTVRWAVSTLAKENKIRTTSPNQWVLA